MAIKASHVGSAAVEQSRKKLARRDSSCPLSLATGGDLSGSQTAACREMRFFHAHAFTRDSRKGILARKLA